MSAAEVTDDAIRDKLKELIKDANLEQTTARSIRKDLEQHFGVPLDERKAFISEELNKLLNEGDNDADEEEDAAPAKKAKKKEKRCSLLSLLWRVSRREDACSRAAQSPCMCRCYAAPRSGSRWTMRSPVSPPVCSKSLSLKLPAHSLKDRRIRLQIAHQRARELFRSLCKVCLEDR